MKNLSRAIVLIFLFLFSLTPVRWGLAESPLIVEVQIAGKKNSDDFIKIYNPTNSDIYLGNYQGSYLRLVKRTKTSTKDSTIKSWSKEPEAKIPAHGFYLWANTDYSTISQVNASTPQTIAANNGIALRLGPENTGLILDAVGWGDFNNVLFEGSPFSENPAANQQLKRKLVNGFYQDTNNNSQDFYLSPPSESSQPKTETTFEEETQPKSQSEEPKSITYPSGVVINEILPDPEGLPDSEEEYIEIFNKNNFTVDLSHWKIADTIGKPTIYTFPEGKTIGPKEFLVLFRPETKITLNNLNGDGLKLILPDETIIDEVNYEKAIKGQSYNRISTGWAWSNILTPGQENNISAPKIEEPAKIDINTASLPELEKTESLKKGLAAVSQPFSQEHLDRKVPKSLFLFLIALTLAIFSGIIILILKKKLKSIDLSKNWSKINN